MIVVCGFLSNTFSLNLNISFCIRLIAHHLIAYIRSWQEALNEASLPKGLSAFRFNTYIISVLVIFFLQVNQKFPKIAGVPRTESKFIDHVPHVEKESLKRLISDFFLRKSI